MPLFSSSVNNNILVAIEYVKILVKGSYAMESVLQDLAKQPLGRVSESADRVLRGVREGKPLEESFADIAGSVGHENLGKFLLILKEGDVLRRLCELSDRVMQERSLMTDSFIEDLAGGLGRVMVLMTVPIALFFIPILEHALEGAGDVLPQINIPSFIPLAVIGIDLLILSLVLAKLRYSE